jgi:putative transposase
VNAPDAPGLAELGEAARAKALLRWRVLRPHLEDGVALVHAAREAGVSERTAQRWLARYRAGGLVGLAAAPRSDRGGRRMPDELVAMIEGDGAAAPAAEHRDGAPPGHAGRRAPRLAGTQLRDRPCDRARA